MANIFLTDIGFDYKLGNPFSEEGQFNENWVMIKVVEDKSNQNRAGNFGESFYIVLLSKSFEGWQYKLMDFICYYSEYNNINIIISIEKDDYINSELRYKGHCNKDRELRSYENEILVHSTTKESWDKIKESGCLKSWNTAKRDGDIKEEIPIGQMLGDPINFRDYIMIGGMSYHNEIVVASKQRGELCYDGNMKYVPGARIYLDANKIARDGLLIRDGIHVKVRDVLELKPYMLCVVTLNDFDRAIQEWTPLRFSQEADKLFKKKLS